MRSTARSPRRLLAVLMSLCLVLASAVALSHDAAHLSSDTNCMVCATLHPTKTALPTVIAISHANGWDEAPWTSHAIAILRVDFTKPSARAPPRLS